MPSISRSRRGLRALVAAVGLGLIATPVALVATPAQAADPVDINILGINDFHGRIKSNGVEAGAAVLAGAVDQIRTAHPNTVFASAGDLIGAATFESFIAHDKPTIDALNEAGLEVSSVGNHEFDQGYDDLVNRVMAPYDATSNPYGGAAWKYLGANVKMKTNGDPALDPTWVKDFGGIEVGFVGAVTEHLDELVSPAGIADIDITDIPTAVNTEADALKADGVDIVVLLVHEGAATTALSSATDPASDFGKIVNGVDGNVDAIISGHTHLSYNHSIPVPQWADDPAHVVKDRPVVSAGQYGYNLNQLDFSVDPATGQVLSVVPSILPLTSPVGTPPVATPNYPADPATQTIVDAAVAESNVLGAVPLGDIAGPFNRAKLADGTTENRGGESTLGNLVADAQRWATRSETTGSAQIAFMNPGGLRADMVGSTPGAYPGVLTYKQAANVQPFANTLVNLEMTGALIAKALEQQWQPTGSARPFLRLGSSNRFRYTYDPTAPAGERILRMTLKGQPILAGDTYSVTVNSFLAAGGDNFGAFAEGTSKQDTGQTDLQGMVDYMAEFASDSALPVDSRQHSVGVMFPDDAPATYEPGDTVAFDLSSLAFTSPADVKDDQVTVSLGGTELGSFPVDNTVGTDILDEYGTSAVSVVLPQGVANGAHLLTIAGVTTGTVARVPVTVHVVKVASTTTAESSPQRVVVDKTEVKIKVKVTTPVGRATGRVKVIVNGKTYGVDLTNGKGSVTLKEFSHTGKQTIRVKYLGNDTTRQSSTTLKLRVHRR